MGLSDQEKRAVAALGQTMFPRNKSIDLDGDDVGVVAWVEEYVRRMPPVGRTQIRALINTFELGYGAWAMRPGATFSSAKRKQREAYLESWETSSTYAQRMLFQGLRAMMTFSYADAPEVMAAIRPEEHS